MIPPEEARYRAGVAVWRLGNALGIEFRPEEEQCLRLERLAAQAERLASGMTRADAYATGYGSDTVQPHEGET